jgi:hypothetical protein
MYGIQNRIGNQWVVVDTHGQTMCIGTMRQCEDWLDCRDNLPATGAASRRQEAVDFAVALAHIAVGR